MNPISSEDTVAQLVTDRPGRARVFERLGVNYCCGGNRPLAEVCADKGLDVEAVMIELTALEASENGERDWSEVGLAELCDHIVETHHAYLKQELPRLSPLVSKVARVHGGDQPGLIEVERVFASLAAELDSHMAKEEHVLFPACRSLEGCGDSGFPTLMAPIASMSDEHDEVGVALERLREVTEGYLPPAGACNSYRAMLDGLAELEADLHLHIHEENNILFPRALELESAV